MQQSTPEQMNAQLLGAMQKSTGIKCSNCEGFFFEPTVLLRKISRFLLTPPGTQDAIFPVQAFRCQDCQMPLLEMFPEGMQDVEEALGITKQPDSKIKLT
jgi:hypothetical protein